MDLVLERLLLELKKRSVRRVHRFVPRDLVPLAELELYVYGEPDTHQALLEQREAIFSACGELIVSWSETYLFQRSIHAVFARDPAPPYHVDIWLRAAPGPELSRSELAIADTAPPAAAIEPRREAPPDRAQMQEMLHSFLMWAWSFLSKVHKGQHEWAVFDGCGTVLEIFLLPIIALERGAAPIVEPPDFRYFEDRFGRELTQRIRALPLSFDRTQQVHTLLQIVDLFRAAALPLCTRHGLIYPQAAESALRTLAKEHFGVS